MKNIFKLNKQDRTPHTLQKRIANFKGRTLFISEPKNPGERVIGTYSINQNSFLHWK